MKKHSKRIFMVWFSNKLSSKITNGCIPKIKWMSLARASLSNLPVNFVILSFSLSFSRIKNILKISFAFKWGDRWGNFKKMYPSFELQVTRDVIKVYFFYTSSASRSLRVEMLIKANGNCNDRLYPYVCYSTL